jgi:hypothetical protein
MLFSFKQISTPKKGYDVVLVVKSVHGVADRDPIAGKLVGRDVHETTVTFK